MSFKAKMLYLFKNPFRILFLPFLRLPYFKFLREASHLTFAVWFKQKILNIGGNREAYWPVASTSRVYNPKNILVGVETSPGIMGGCYIQGVGKIYIGDYTQIAPNVSIISGNHDLHDLRIHIPSEVKIGNYCWLGAGCIVLPGVKLGDFTIVGAGAVVTKSFEEGYCVLAGNPARKIKELVKEDCKTYKSDAEYIGYIKASRFEEFRRSKLNI